MRKLYEGVVIPKMLYAADVWCTNLISKGRGKRGGRGERGFALKMARVHRMAGILITGAMRSTASGLLDTHANILPFQQILRNHCHRATLWFATLHASNPIHKVNVADRERDRESASKNQTKVMWAKILWQSTRYLILPISPPMARHQLREIHSSWYIALTFVQYKFMFHVSNTTMLQRMHQSPPGHFVWATDQVQHEEHSGSLSKSL